MSIQQVQAAHYLVRILEEILAKDETLTPADRTKYQEMKEKYQREEADLKQLVREKLWSEDGSFFFNMNASTGEFTNIATPTGLWALAAGVATKEQADRMIKEYVLNSNKMFRQTDLLPYAMITVHLSQQEDTGTGAIWSPTSYQWIKGLQNYGYDELAFKEAVRHTNALADVCVNGAYDRYGKFLHTLWENYSSEYSIPGSTEHSDTQPSRSNFVGWAGRSGIGSVIENIVSITIKEMKTPLNGILSLRRRSAWTISILTAQTVKNFVNLSCSERMNDTSGATLTVKADHDFELRVKSAENHKTIQVAAEIMSIPLTGQTEMGLILASVQTNAQMHLLRQNR